MSGTRDRLLEVAERLVRSRGYSGFSFADLVLEVGIRKASIHHHFPTKGDLGAALVDDYIARFRALLSDIERGEASTTARIQSYGRVYADALRGGMLCLCGMLATEALVLPAPIQTRIRIFMGDQLDWLERVIAAGQRAREIRSAAQPRAVAEHLLGALQGASLVAWAMQDAAIIDRAIADALAGLTR